jgi:hypothetical protein
MPQFGNQKPVAKIDYIRPSQLLLNRSFRIPDSASGSTFPAPALVIVLLPVDIFTGSILHPLELALLGPAYFAVGFRPFLRAADIPLLPVDPSGFSSGKLPAFQALLDAPALVILAGIAPRGHGIQRENRENSGSKNH